MYKKERTKRTFIREKDQITAAIPIEKQNAKFKRLF